MSYQVHQGGHVVSKTTTQSYGGQVAESFLWAGCGLVVVGGSLALIWLNETRQYQRTRAIRHATQQLVNVSDYAKENEGKVVYVCGPLTSHEEVKDDRIDFEMKTLSDSPPPYGEINQSAVATGSTFRNFLQLKRKVEMLQWEERQESSTKNKIGGQKKTTTVYSYLMAWRNHPIRSENFQHGAEHHNPDMPIRQEVFRPSVFYLSQFVVPPTVADCLESKAVFPPALIWNRNRIEHDGSNWYMIRKSEPNQERVGDIRVSYTAVSGPQTVSLIGKQQGVSLVPCEGLDSVLAAPGPVPPAILLSASEHSNALLGSAVRWIGGIGSVVGFRLLFDPLVTGAVVVPLMSDLVGAVAWTIALPLGITAAIITIPFAKLHCRSPRRLRLPVATWYFASLIGGMGILSVTIARAMQQILPTKQSTQVRAESLGSRVGAVVGAFDAARKRL